MEIAFFLKGLIIGFSIAAPVGPIGILCIRRTLAQGSLSGFFSGLGAATADGLYGTVAAFGLTLISNFLIQNQTAFRFLGGLFLLYLGYGIFKSQVAEDAPASQNRGGLLKNYLSTFFLTITNPMTILSFGAIFAGLGLGNTGGNYYSATLLVLGVFLGSAAWWLTLSFGVGLFKKKLTHLGWVNKISAFIIFFFGFLALASLFH